jgi:serine phosphatase RsbU (regulator of sigma subunit)
MKPLSLTESIRLPEGRAVQRRFDDVSWTRLRWFVPAIAVASLIGALVTTFEEGYPVYLSIAWGVDFVAATGLLIVRRRAFFERQFRKLLLGFILLQTAVLLVCSPGVEFNYALCGYLVPFALLFVRMRRIELVGLLLAHLVLALWWVLGPVHETPLPWGAQLGMSIGAGVMALATYVVGSRLSARLRRRFLIDWRLEYSREREQSRMREELADARQIQLSMLPRETPQLGWIDLASASLPATEVGGDYFDYVPLDEERLAIVVGDVAGHGMASGLVLAAIRGGLHLLKEDLARPLEALKRLDRMIQEIAPGRMYVTLQIAILDHRHSRITLVSAGHPPALHFRAANDETVELGSAAVPLGTKLETRLTEQSGDLRPGDVLVFYSDGLPEATDLRQEQFGDERMRQVVDRSATGRSAAEIRTLILDSVTRFKGDVELRDDLTLVVAKIAG